MNLLAICPTYGRPPHLLENLLACWEQQDYPPEKRWLLILDDLGNISRQVSGPGRWEVASTSSRYASLPHKYNALWANQALMPLHPHPSSPESPFDDRRQAVHGYVVMEDDDVYLPWHLTAHSLTLCGGLTDWWKGPPLNDTGRFWSHPSQVWSTYGDKLNLEPTGGRFHASLAIWRDYLQHVGGWPLTKRADFDQQMIQQLKSRSTGPGDPTRAFLPSYVFRWQDTGCSHGQAGMRSPDDETWYDRYEPQYTKRIERLTPRLDESGEAIFRQLATPYRPQMAGSGLRPAAL